MAWAARSSQILMGALFVPEPVLWGMRGDRFVWRTMHSHLNDVAVPAKPAPVNRLLRATFADLVGMDVDDATIATVRCEDFTQPGPVGESIQLLTWRNVLFPLLLSRIDDATRRPATSHAPKEASTRSKNRPRPVNPPPG